MPKVEPKIGDKLRRANVTNIIKKLNAGKTLTKSDKDALKEHERASEGAAAVQRMGKTNLAVELGITRRTLDEYLNRSDPPPPQPDADGEYSVEDTATYIAVNGAKAVTSAEMRRLREARERIRVEREEMELAELRGRLVDKETIEPQIAAACAIFGAALRQIFESEMPAKYQGKSVVDCRILNEQGVDRVMRQLKEAHLPLRK